YAETLSVGAMGQKRVVAAWSSSQRFDRDVEPLVPDAVAPGVDIIFALPGGGLGPSSGNSMATPPVDGLAALLFQAKPGAPVAHIEDAIFKSCALLPKMTADRVRLGAPNGPLALRFLTGIQLSTAKAVWKARASVKIVSPTRKH